MSLQMRLGFAFTASCEDCCTAVWAALQRGQMLAPLCLLACRLADLAAVVASLLQRHETIPVGHDQEQYGNHRGQQRPSIPAQPNQAGPSLRRSLHVRHRPTPPLAADPG